MHYDFYYCIVHLFDNLTPQQSAERIADHFADISQSFLPLSIDILNDRVKVKLKNVAPTMSVEQTWLKIGAAKKPRSEIPDYLPNQITKEFSVELATPLCMIINKIGLGKKS